MRTSAVAGSGTNAFRFDHLSPAEFDQKEGTFEREKERDREKDNRPEMESLVLSPISPNQDLIPELTAVSAFPRNVKFNQSTQNFLPSTGEVICLTDLLPSQGEVTLPQTIYSFNFLFLPFSAFKTLSFCTTLWISFLFARLGAARLMNP